MGKRELLLIVGFIVAGAIVYQATAPARSPGETGVSIARILSGVKRALHGNRGSAEVVTASTHPVTGAMTEVRLIARFTEVTITGEDRSDIACDLRVVSNGFDDGEAKALAGRSALKVDAAGSSISFDVSYPREGQQRGFVTLRIPSRLRVRVDQAPNRTSITNVAAAELVSARGDTTLKQIHGRTALTQRGGRLIMEDVGSAKIAARGGTEVTIARVTGDASFDMQGGELKASEIAGAIDVESRSADLTFTKLPATRSPMRINVVGGQVSLQQVRSDVRIDSRETEVDVVMAEGASALAIYAEGDQTIEVTPPPGGYQLDAVVSNGRLTVPDNTLRVAVTGSEQRVSGAVSGGGPMITLRSGHGDISIRGR